jgi:hypothetical protein
VLLKTSSSVLPQLLSSALLQLLFRSAAENLFKRTAENLFKLTAATSLQVHCCNSSSSLLPQPLFKRTAATSLQARCRNSSSRELPQIIFKRAGKTPLQAFYNFNAKFYVNIFRPNMCKLVFSFLNNSAYQPVFIRCPIFFPSLRLDGAKNLERFGDVPYYISCCFQIENNLRDISQPGSNIWDRS